MGRAGGGRGQSRTALGWHRLLLGLWAAYLLLCASVPSSFSPFSLPPSSLSFSPAVFSHFPSTPVTCTLPACAEVSTAPLPQALPPRAPSPHTSSSLAGAPSLAPCTPCLQISPHLVFFSSLPSSKCTCPVSQGPQNPTEWMDGLVLGPRTCLPNQLSG